MTSTRNVLLSGTISAGAKAEKKALLEAALAWLSVSSVSESLESSPAKKPVGRRGRGRAAAAPLRRRGHVEGDERR